jgi:hypothetical protein
MWSIRQVDLGIFRTDEVCRANPDVHPDEALIFLGPEIGNLHRACPPSSRELSWLMRYLDLHGFACSMETNFAPFLHDIHLNLGASPFLSNMIPHGHDSFDLWADLSTHQQGQR